jgi:hypothetical protein
MEGEMADMFVSSASVRGIEIKSGYAEPLVTCDVRMEMARGQGMPGPVVTVKVSRSFDATETWRQSTDSAAVLAHQALQIAASAPVERLQELIAASLLRES